MSVRTERVSGEIQKIISATIARDHADVSDGLVTITEVVASPDLRNAKVYVSILGGKISGEKVVRILNDRMHEIRAELAHNIHLRYIPELHFYLDESSTNAARVAELLAEWHEKERESGHHVDGANTPEDPNE